MSVREIAIRLEVSRRADRDGGRQHRPGRDRARDADAGVERRKSEVIATLGGGPNGAALGPDGAVYVTNNGGFEWHDRGGLLFPGDRPHDYDDRAHRARRSEDRQGRAALRRSATA